MATLVALSCLFLFTEISEAQWRIRTPRDTIFVNANGTPAPGKLNLATGTDVYLQCSGTFSFWTSQPNEGIDADYTYKVPGWNLFSPLESPPTFNSTLFDWGLTIKNTSTDSYFKDLAPGTVYQNSHIYTARIPSQGNYLQYRIKAPSVAYWNSASGGITIKGARWTAGIAVKSLYIDFGSVLVGQPSTLLDSIASYGIDPLSIDSIAVVGLSPANNTAFSVKSEHGAKFTLPNETTNEFRITAIPDGRNDITGELQIFSHNADPNNRQIRIKLHVYGTSPQLVVSPSSINFDLVRINTTARGSAFIFSKGNSTLTVTNADYVPKPIPVDTGVFSMAPPAILPFDVSPGSIGVIKTNFNPKKRQHYHGMLYVKGIGVPPDSVELNGDGAEPVPVFSDTVLDYGFVYKDADSTRSLRLTNKGNWPISVVNAYLDGPTRSVFSFTPTDTAFYVAPDSSRLFKIKMHPGSGLQGYNYRAYLVLVYDDNSIDSVLLTGREKEPALDFTPREYNFNKVKVGATVTRVVSSAHNTTSSIVDLWDQHISPGDQYFTQDPLLPTKINADATLPVRATFAPQTQGAFQAYLVTNAGGHLDSIRLLGIGAVAKAIFSRNPLAYGVVKSDSTQVLVSTLHDSGDYALNAIRIEITGRDAADFKVLYQPTGKTPVLPYTIMEDSTMPIEVSFVTHARTGSVHIATLCVYYDDSTSDCIPLEAIEEAQYLQFGQSSVDFGDVRIKSTSTKDAYFKNFSGKSLKVDTVAVSGVPFALGSQLAPVPSKDSGAVKVSFTPPARGVYTGYLRGSGGDFRTDSIQIRGKGVAPIALFQPDTVVDFGIVQLGATKPQTLYLANIGDYALRTVNVQLLADQYGEFGFSKVGGGDPTQTTVAVNASAAQYALTFTPSLPLVYHSAKLLFTFDDSTQRTVLLKGYDESPYIVLDLDTVNFGRVRIGSSPTNLVNLVSTYTDTLSVHNVALNGDPEFTASPINSTMAIPPRTLQGISVTFKPTVIGTFAAKLTILNDANSHPDTTFILGIGAKPIPEFFADSLRTDTLDFGSMFNGYTANRIVVLKNTGNWTISTLAATPSGTDAADFTMNFPAQLAVAPDSAAPLVFTFKASTPYQAAARFAHVDFMLDDSSTFTLYLKAQDIAPVTADFKFDNASMRPGDVVYPNLRLRSAIPDSLNVNHITGVINWDPAVATLIKVEQSAQLVRTNQAWVLTPAGNDPPGQYTYDLATTSPVGHLSSPMGLLQLQFRPAPNTNPGAQTTVSHSQFSFPMRTELAPQETQGIIVIDSACGNTHLTSGSATASFIEMNMPNPFGTRDGNEVTTIPFSVGTDGTMVTIRVLDVTGREVRRPIDHIPFTCGFYNLKISADELPSSGTYMYEFTAGADAPVVRKMLVRK